MKTAQNQGRVLKGTKCLFLWKQSRDPIAQATQSEWLTTPGDRNPRGRRGALTLEFALAFPIFLLLIFALVEVGRAMMVVSLLNNAARAGCREAILPTATPESVNEMVDPILKNQGVDGYSVSVLVNNQPNSMTTAVKHDLISIQITVPFSEVSWIPGLNLLSCDLQGQYVLPHE